MFVVIMVSVGLVIVWLGQRMPRPRHGRVLGVPPWLDFGGRNSLDACWYVDVG